MIAALFNCVNRWMLAWFVIIFVYVYVGLEIVRWWRA